MNKERIVVEYADTLEELQVSGMKWNHDHARIYYFGKTKNVPEHLQEFITENKNEFSQLHLLPWVLLAEEDKPNSIASINFKDVITQLHKEAELIEKEAILLYNNKDLHKMHIKIDLARSLRMVANYLDGVVSF